jgi:hypothetical protein
VNELAPKKKPIWKKWWFWTVIVLVIIGASNSKNSSEKPGPAAAAAPKEARPLKRVAGLGETVSVGSFSYVVSTAEFAQSVGNEYTRKTADGIYLVLRIAIRNDDKKAHTLDNAMFKLVDGQGREFEASTDASTAMEMSNQGTIFLKQCQPGITTSGYLPFEVPGRAGSYTLKVTGGFWSGETADILVSS